MARRKKRRSHKRRSVRGDTVAALKKRVRKALK